MHPVGRRGGGAPVLPHRWLPAFVLKLAQAAAGLDPEVALQRDLARKLGLKRGKTKMGGEDGLDEFLDGAWPNFFSIVFRFLLRLPNWCCVIALQGSAARRPPAMARWEACCCRQASLPLACRALRHAELGGIDDIFEGGSEGAAAEEAQAPAGKKRKQAAAAAGSSDESEEEEEEEGSGSEGEEGSDDS